MSLSFLPDDVRAAVSSLNYNLISEIRLRRGQPVMLEYAGKYVYLTRFGTAESPKNALISGELNGVINAAADGCIYKYTEQMKSGFITVGHGVRIGIAGEYVTQGGEVKAIDCVTSLNIRIPHVVKGCADGIIKSIFNNGLCNSLVFSEPGLGKTTILRELASTLGTLFSCNVLVFDERNEIAAIDGEGNGFDLGDRVDVIRCGDKKSAVASAIRAMKPQLIVTDELYGADDLLAVKYVRDCGIKIIASSHITDREILRKYPFDYFINLTGIGAEPVIYDKNFVAHSGGGADDFGRGAVIGK